ncbi:hypothetical protein Brsp02_04568 [Brucella sp. NBRC 113783]
MCIVNVEKQPVFFLQTFQFINVRAASHGVNAIANVGYASVFLTDVLKHFIVVVRNRLNGGFIGHGVVTLTGLQLPA